MKASPCSSRSFSAPISASTSALARMSRIAVLPYACARTVLHLSASPRCPCPPARAQEPRPALTAPLSPAAAAPDAAGAGRLPGWCGCRMRTAPHSATTSTAMIINDQNGQAGMKEHLADRVQAEHGHAEPPGQLAARHHPGRRQLQHADDQRDPAPGVETAEPVM